MPIFPIINSTYTWVFLYASIYGNFVLYCRKFGMIEFDCNTCHQNWKLQNFGKVFSQPTTFMYFLYSKDIFLP